MKPMEVLGLLSADGPFPEHAEKLMAYGQFVGSWDVEAIWYDRQGGQRQASAEWHFAWVLGGMGIQDVLFATGATPNDFGTSLRCYDAASDVWQIVWMQPSGGRIALYKILGPAQQVFGYLYILASPPEIKVVDDRTLWIGNVTLRDFEGASQN